MKTATTRPTYVVKEKASYWVVTFIPCGGAPGFTHRIYINGLWTGSWLAQEFKPNGKNAIYFVEKHTEIPPNERQ